MKPKFDGIFQWILNKSLDLASKSKLQAGVRANVFSFPENITDVIDKTVAKKYENNSDRLRSFWDIA